MANVTHKYETVFVVNPTIGEDAVKAIVEKFTALIAENGKVESVEEWGTRRLAYEIADLKEGYYTLVNFESDSKFPSELDRIFNITDGVLRSLIIKKDK